MNAIYLLISIFAIGILVGMAVGQTDSEDGFAIYLLPKKDKANSWGDSNTYSLDEIKLTGKPFINQNDIDYYNKDTRQLFTFVYDRELITMNYELVAEGKKFSISGEGRPFVAAVGKVPIYSGAFWLNISKQGFSGITIIPTGVQDRKLIWQINYGYPREKFFRRDEFRNAVNDSRILKTLEKRGKLYEDLEIIAKCSEVKPSMKRRPSFYITLEVISVTKGSFAEKEIKMELWDSPDSFGQAVVYEGYKLQKIDTEKRFKVKFEKQVTNKVNPNLMFREAVVLDDKQK